MTDWVRRLYPRACDKPPNAPSLSKVRRQFFKAAGLNFALLQLLFFCLFCYIFGSLYLQTSHTHNMKILFVDYDDGAIGRAVRQAYSQLQSETFPTLVEQTPAQYQSSQELRESVCKTHYWAALFVSAGASARLSGALGGDAAAVATYNSSDVMSYIWNEAAYTTAVDSAISGSIQTLAQLARVKYSTINGTGNVQSVTSPGALAVLADPWKLVSINIQPTTQGSRAIYNTLIFILILVQEFFYLGTINGLYASFKMYTRVSAYRVVLIRNLNSITYCLVGSLSTAGAIWIFKSGWEVNGAQFMLTWMILWLFAHINFLTLDVCTVWLPHPYVPMSLITWVILNVTSVLLPFDLSVGFYKIGYIFPTHEVYVTLTDIWSGGCNPQLRYSLPILFAWEVVTLCLSSLGVFRRSHFANLAEDRQAAEFKERLDAAMDVERRERAKDRARWRKDDGEDDIDAAKDQPSNAEIEKEKTEEVDERAELAEAIERVNRLQRRIDRRGSQGVEFGPSFGLTFTHQSSDSDTEETQTEK